MIDIGGRPILWHIMKIYSHYGINDFIICLGYRGYFIKEFFANYYLHSSDVTFDMCNDHMEVHQNTCEPWRVTLIETGPETMTGGRLKRVAPYLGDEDFCFTYGDGVADIAIDKLITMHKSHGCMATMTAVRPPGRFGHIDINATKIVSFTEKPQGDGSWINGGFFVLSPKVVDYIEGDATFWEREPLENLARDGQLHAYKHQGFWQPLDTLRDKNLLEKLWEEGAPWKKW